ncbi:hypothetical protein GZL_07653 [Streptomyces sp. 769]|nr:hypothetical protein GZL_07653 [Streptomyces sp. 769]
MRQHHDETGTLAVIAGAYGPDWFATLRGIRHRPEQPHMMSTVDAEPTELSDQEVLVRWATSAEFQQRRHAHGLRHRPRSSRCCATRTPQPRQPRSNKPAKLRAIRTVLAFCPRNACGGLVSTVTRPPHAAVVKQ